MAVLDATDKKAILGFQSWENDLHRLLIDTGNGVRLLEQRTSAVAIKDLSKPDQVMQEVYVGGGASVTINATHVPLCCGVAMVEECECDTYVGSMLVRRDKEHKNYRIEIHAGC